MRLSAKKILVMNFPFLMDSLPLYLPLTYPRNIQSLLSVTKAFSQCLLRLKKNFRNCRQITFVILNEFCPLSNPNVVYIFVEGNELNIAFPFVILMSILLIFLKENLNVLFLNFQQKSWSVRYSVLPLN